MGESSRKGLCSGLADTCEAGTKAATLLSVSPSGWTGDAKGWQSWQLWRQVAAVLNEVASPSQALEMPPQQQLPWRPTGFFSISFGGRGSEAESTVCLTPVPDLWMFFLRDAPPFSGCPFQTLTEYSKCFAMKELTAQLVYGAYFRAT